MKKLIIANWKMNPGTKKEALELFDAIKSGVGNKEGAEVVICPPFIYLSQLSGLTLGAQNMFYKESGAFTGQISSIMLKDLGVAYVLLGHSEARKYLHETNQDINKKIRECLNAGLKPVLCIGDNEGEDKQQVLEIQIREGLADLSKEQMLQVIIAYEPVWAIGTGNNCSPEETKSAIAMIKGILVDLYDDSTASAVRVLYGGSVNAQNSASYISDAGANGLLVGGASLKPEEFTKIVSNSR